MKKKLGERNLLYPMPLTLVGATVAGKANFMAVAHVGTLNLGGPHLITISLGKVHYTNQGIKENGTFSLNIVSKKILASADYAGIVSGQAVDK